jgi:hypothetical protein
MNRYKSLVGKTVYKINSDGDAFVGKVIDWISNTQCVDVWWQGSRSVREEIASRLKLAPAEVRLEYARRVAELGKKAAEFDNSLEAENAVAKAA